MNGYIIIGDNGEEFGPATADEIRNWISDRRVDAHTLIRLEETQEWKRASEWPEFARSLSAFLVAQQSHSGQPASAPTYAPTYAPRANKLAITGLVLGILSMFTCCCPILPIPGLACSVTALNQIREKPSLYSGKGAAITGLALSLISIGLFVFLQLSGASVGGFFDGLIGD